jgi:hypothetical protein
MPLYSSPPIDPTTFGHRLTGLTGIAVPAGDISAITSIYLTPCTSTLMGLYDGSRWVLRETAQITIALGTLTATLPYDVYVVWNGTAVAVELLAWTSDVARATNLTTQNGVLVKTGDATRRYIGTIRTTTTTTTEDSKTKRFIWNQYNQVRRQLYIAETTASWAYTTATMRQTRATATNKFEYVTGDPATLLRAMAYSIYSSSSIVAACSGIGIDQIISNVAILTGGDNTASGAAIKSNAEYEGYPGYGYHAVNWLEYGGTGCTFYGTNSLAQLYQSGMSGEILA